MTTIGMITKAPGRFLDRQRADTNVFGTLYEQTTIRPKQNSILMLIMFKNDQTKLLY